MNFVPTNAGILTISGGVLVAIGGLSESLNGTHWPGIGNGLFIVLAGVFMIILPENMTAWGILGYVLAIASLVTASLGGFLLGFILTVLGGVYARRYKVPDYGGAPPGTMIPSGMYGSPPPPMAQPLSSAVAVNPTADPPQVYFSAPPLGALTCPRCGRQARYVPQYSRYYCDFDRQYV